MPQPAILPTPTPHNPSLLEDYALIGDCQTAALVSRQGSIDWLCLPRFDSGACFAALLGTPEHGRFQLCPQDGFGPYTVRRRYLDGTLILETTFEGPAGAVAILDFMPPRTTTPDLVRLVIGLRGQVPMHLELIIRCDYGAIVPWVRSLDTERGEPIGITAVAGPDLLCLRTSVPLRGENLKTVADFTVSAGQRVPFVLTYSQSHLPLPQPVHPELALQSTTDIWARWSRICTYRGPYADAVLRSLITLKALTYSHTGGIVAAPTTSLPEQPGGVRNWDYRYCWIRDATFTLYSLVGAGYVKEARNWREWLLRAVAGAPSQLQIMYGLGGERRLTETELPWLPGYGGARPVRIGNAAYGQRQLDVFGEVMDALHVARCSGLEDQPAAWHLQQALMDYLASVWTEPDEGIWEVRGGPRQFTHSKVMVWVALDRAIKSAEQFHLDGPLDHWRQLRDVVHKEVCQRGYDQGLGSFVQSYGSRALDASLLMIPLVGFLPATDERVRGTVAAIRRHLVCESGFVRRYANEPATVVPVRDGMHPVDGLPPGEGSFLPCTFWLVDNLVLMGERAEAQVLFERLLALRNDVGLLAEEYDARAGRLLGNFPQAFSHVSLVNSASNLTHVRAGPAHHRRSS